MLTATASYPHIPNENHRSEIDGLRGIAALLVVLYHARIPGFESAYVGVDIFFVLSGFLIANSIDADLASRRFSYFRFYERRFFRLIPVLSVVIMWSFVVGYLLLLPADLSNLGQEGIASLLFSSNFLLWVESDYFDNSSQYRLLLHTWSLGVEEQFYLLFPILFVTLSRNQSWISVSLVLVLLGSSSFILTLLYAEQFSSAAFYLFPFRAWELLLGVCILVWSRNKPFAVNSFSANLIECGGAIAIIFGLLLIRQPATVHPGPVTLLICCGVALLLLSEGRGCVSKFFLRLQFFVWLGALSYSIYLWHQPVFVLTKYVLTEQLTFTQSAACGVATVILAMFTHRYVENPARRLKFADLGASRASLAGFFLVVLLLAGAVLSTGLPHRLSTDILTIASARDDINPGNQECQSRPGRLLDPTQACKLGAAADSTVAIMGDSMTSSLAAALDPIWQQERVSAVHLWHNGCAPILTLKREKDLDCQRYNLLAHDYVVQKKFDVVILFAWWSQYYHATRMFDATDSGPFMGLATSSMNPDYLHSQARKAHYLQALEATVDELLEVGSKVILVGPSPEMDIDVPSVAARRMWYSGTSGVAESGSLLSENLSRSRQISSAMTDLAADPRVRYVDVMALMCEAQSCQAVADGRALYADTHHMTVSGATRLARQIQDNLLQLLE